jgi:hypothetical protein
MVDKIRSWKRFLSSKWQSIHLDYPVDFRPRFQSERDLGLTEINQLLQASEASFLEQIERILSFEKDLVQFKKRSDEPNALLPGWNNGYLPGLDMAALFTFVAHHKPNRYVEVGSGNSTLVAAAAKSQYSPLTEITSIDPYPRAEIDQLSQVILREPFETLEKKDILNSLESGDMLFIDNSHRVLPNSDATVFFLEWLPKLADGVMVQIHDIYLPWDYPQNMCERAYSEQYMLAMAILSNPKRYKPIFPAFWISEQPKLSQKLESIWNHPNTRGVEPHGGSFWIQING